jgi:hypothetical protein
MLMIAQSAVFACGGESESLRFSATVAEDVAPIARYEARVFADRRCDDLAISRGRVDIARTATAAIVTTAADPNAFEPIDLRGFSGQLALEIRALSADGVPIARRCVPVDASVEETRAVLARFAPSGATVRITSPAAISSGLARRDVTLELTDASGMPIVNGFVSSGPLRPLVATDDRGIAHVRTPTDTPDFEGDLRLEVYGVPGTGTVHAAHVREPKCPEAAWSREIVPGLTGAPASMTFAAGYVFLARQRSSTSASSLLEVFALESQSAGLRSVTTASTAGRGPIAAGMIGDQIVIAIAEEDRFVHLHRFDATERRLLPAGRFMVPALPGRVPIVRALAVGDPFGTGRAEAFVGGEGIPSGVARSAGGEARAALPGEQEVLDLVLAGRDLLVTSDRLTRFSPVADRFAATSTSTARGRFASSNAGLAIFGNARVLSLSTSGAVVGTGGDLPFEGSSAAVTSLNDDEHADIVAANGSDLALVVGDGLGNFLTAVTCEATGEIDALVSLPPTSDGRPRWAVLERIRGRIEVHTPPR